MVATGTMMKRSVSEDKLLKREFGSNGKIGAREPSTG
jgi:hypothetical protein